ncbi:MAG: AAA family ATPase [Selenomonadaceae bacterium]
MQIKKIHLDNFRGIKELDLDLMESVTIYGPNGSGKTTVANAISWVLTDQPITGEKDFTPKTEGTHNLNHIAEMTLASQNGDIVLKKDFHEIWKKKRGSKNPEFAGHETEYFVNGVPHKKKDYETVVETFCNTNLQNIPMMIRVGYFAEDMKMEARRKILFEVLGDISDEDVIKQAGLEKLNEILLVPGADDGKRYSPEEFMAIAKNRRREINRKLDEIPARIDELTKTMPEEEETPEKAQKRSDEILKLEGKKQVILTTPADNKTASLRAVIAGYRAEIEKGREIYLKEASDANRGIIERIRGIQSDIATLENQKLEALSNRNSLVEKINAMEAKRETLLKDFEALKAQRWEPAQEICPTCGQSLPAEMVNDLRHQFLDKLGKEKERINEAGKKCSKELISKAEVEKQALEAVIRESDMAIAQLKAGYESVNAQLKSPPPYEETDRYKEAAARIAEMEAKLNEINEAPKDNPELKEIDEKLKALRTEEAAAEAAEGTRKRIEELEAEKQELGSELDKTDAGIAMVEDFYRQKVALVTNKIDSEFETIKFLLFKEQINGGLKEVCEPMIPDKEGNLVEYKSANTAAQVNAGLEIIKVLSDHYGVYLPVILDRAESVTTPIEMPRHQLIKLKVTKDINRLEIQKEG